jgi:hypothetical protein
MHQRENGVKAAFFEENDGFLAENGQNLRQNRADPRFGVRPIRQKDAGPGFGVRPNPRYRSAVIPNLSIGNNSRLSLTP